MSYHRTKKPDTSRQGFHDVDTEEIDDDYEELLRRCGVEQDADAAKPQQHDSTMFARGRLADAKKVFASRDWEVLPQGRRGHAILR